ncbi:MAG: [NiFe]-hydrogenase assembly chaperone HybE [Pseudomonadota bacterium]
MKTAAVPQSAPQSVPRASAAAWGERVRALEAAYLRVQNERMQGLGLLHPALQVQAIGFAPAPEQSAVAEGVLLTPWFMSLVRLPLQAQSSQGRIGRRATHGFGAEAFEFLGTHLDGVGFHESCALFSPMNGFDTQARALETAHSVLQQLRTAVAQAAAGTGAAASGTVAAAPMARRDFFRRPLGAGARS